ncbi:Polyribonucleotide nucleotidyltransferase, partial [Varanus komodoensis]
MNKRKKVVRTREHEKHLEGLEDLVNQAFRIFQDYLECHDILWGLANQYQDDQFHLESPSGLHFDGKKSEMVTRTPGNPGKPSLPSLPDSIRPNAEQILRMAKSINIEIKLLFTLEFLPAEELVSRPLQKQGNPRKVSGNYHQMILEDQVGQDCLAHPCLPQAQEHQGFPSHLLHLKHPQTCSLNHTDTGDQGKVSEGIPMADQEMALAGVTGVVVRCDSCDMFALLPQERQGYTCPRCKMVTLLEEEVRCLRAERALQAPPEQPPSGQRVEGEATGGVAAETWRASVSLPEEEVRCLRAERALQAPPEQPPSGQRVEGEATGGVAAETWRYVTHRRRRPAWPLPSPGTNLELGKRFSPLGEAGADEASGDQQDPQPETSSGKGATAGEARARARPPTSTRKVQQQVIVVGDSLLRGTEAAVCRPNPETREVCCLLGACIRHVKDRVERLVRSGGHQPLMVIHVGTNDVARQGVVGTTRDFEALGKKLRELKAQVAFLSILPIRGFGPGRDRRASEVNDWLR